MLISRQTSLPNPIASYEEFLVSSFISTMIDDFLSTIAIVIFVCSSSGIYRMSAYLPNSCTSCLIESSEGVKILIFNPYSMASPSISCITPSLAVEEQRDILDVLEYASINSMLPEKQKRELADHLVKFLKMECDPARVEITRETGEIRLTSAGLKWCDARCVKHVWRHNSEISY